MDAKYGASVDVTGKQGIEALETMEINGAVMIHSGIV